MLSNVSELLQTSQMTVIVCISLYQKTESFQGIGSIQSALQPARQPCQCFYTSFLAFILHQATLHLQQGTGGAGRASSAWCRRVKLDSSCSAHCRRLPGAAVGLGTAGGFDAEKCLPAKQHGSGEGPRQRSCPSPMPEQPPALPARLRGLF